VTGAKPTWNLSNAAACLSQSLVMMALTLSYLTSFGEKQVEENPKKAQLHTPCVSAI
jgi:hypothetical protein